MTFFNIRGREIKRIVISLKVKNGDGIFMYFSNSNIISENTFLYNILGMFLDHSSNINKIYYNNFIGNQFNAQDEIKNINKWDNHKKGNYWDDYREIYPNAHKIWLKGIWDTPYEIPSGDNQDRYPLLKPYVSSKEKTFNRISVFFIEKIIENFELQKKTFFLNFLFYLF